MYCRKCILIYSDHDYLQKNFNRVKNLQVICQLQPVKKYWYEKEKYIWIIQQWDGVHRRCEGVVGTLAPCISIGPHWIELNIKQKCCYRVEELQIFNWHHLWTTPKKLDENKKFFYFPQKHEKQQKRKFLLSNKQQEAIEVEKNLIF